jgi:hypothetical protein
MTLHVTDQIVFGSFIACLAVVACHRGQSGSQSLSPVPCSTAPEEGGRLAFSVLGRGAGNRLDANDWKQPFVGSWDITMTVDSTQAFVHQRSVFRPVQPSCSAAGLLQITDTLFALRGDSALAAHLDLDLFGFHGGAFVWPGRVSLHQQGTTLLLDLCPGCFDTGVTAVISARGDSLVGTWSELAFVGRFRAGRIALARRRS